MEEFDSLSRYFLGVAFVQAQHLCYSAVDSRPDDCFGCCTSNSHHRIPVLITSSQYQATIIDAGIAKSTLFAVGSHPRLELTPDAKLPYLHGETRIRGVLFDTSRTEEWICVNLYQAEIPVRTQKLVRDYFQKYPALCDGDIYLMIRFHQRRHNQREAERWLVRLSPSKQKIFNQLRRNSRVAAALDELELFPALWQKFQLGSFPPILSWRCYEEISTYLRSIFHTWETICGKSYHWCDEQTLRCVGGLAPQWSLHHRTFIEDLARRGQLFCRIDDNEERAGAVKRLLDQNGFILTFVTFYKHTKRLETTMLGLRQLFRPRKLRPTVMTFLKSFHIDTNRVQALVQHDDERFNEVPALDVSETAYLQAVLFGLRNRAAMSSPKTRKQWSKTSEPPDWLVQLGCLVSRLGFESDEIAELEKMNPDRCRIRNHMRLERSQSTFTVSTNDFELEASRRCEAQQIFHHRNQDRKPPLMATAHKISLSDQENLQNLFLPSIVSALERKCPDQILTNFGEEVLTLCAFYNYFARCIGETGENEGRTRSSFATLAPTQWLQYPPTLASPSSVYSIHANDTPMDDQAGPSDTPIEHAQDLDPRPALTRVRQVSFFHMKVGQPSSVSHACPATHAEVNSIIRELRSSYKSVVFFTSHQGRYLISSTRAIHRSCVKERRRNSVHYVTDAESHYFWVGKSMKDAKRWGSYYRTEPPDK